MDEETLKEEIARLIWMDGGQVDFGFKFLNKEWIGFRVAHQILALVKEEGYVKLADDQGLPEPEIEKSKLSRFGKNWYTTGYMECRGEMLKSGFRKVEL